MSDKRITDHQHGDAGGAPAAGDVKPTEQGVNRSRRRFTGAGLSASAILTLASRPAFSTTSCSLSGTLSGNTSIPGAVECDATPPTDYLNKHNWPAGFYAGEENPIVTSHVSHEYPDYHELEDAIAASTGALQESCIRYRDWAWPAGTATTIPSPTPAPNKFNDEFAGSGLSASDATMTLMQALEKYPDDVAGHAVAALFNCHTIGTEAFGYSPASLKQFIRESDPGQLLAHLRLLNSR